GRLRCNRNHSSACPQHPCHPCFSRWGTHAEGGRATGSSEGARAPPRRRTGPTSFRPRCRGAGRNGARGAQWSGGLAAPEARAGAAAVALAVALAVAVALFLVGWVGFDQAGILAPVPSMVQQASVPRTGQLDTRDAHNAEGASAVQAEQERRANVEVETKAKAT